MKLRRYILFVISLFFFLTLLAQEGKMDSVNQVDKKGRKQGYWKKDDANALSYQGYFVNGMPKGRFTYTNPKGQLVAVSDYFKDGYACFTTTYYPKSGKKMTEGYYLDKQRDSLWRIYTEEGRLIKEEFYKRNLLEGSTRLYNEKKELIETQEWYRGLRNGKWWQKTEGGTQTTHYLMNLSHGEYTALYPNGRLYISGKYVDGFKEGDWSFYLQDGHQYKKDRYKNNEMQSREVYILEKGISRPLNMDTIVLITIQDRVSTLYTINGAILQADQMFKDLCTIFDTDYFFYANPKTFVSIRMVKDFKPKEGDKAELVLKCPQPFKIEVTEDNYQTIRSLIDSSNVQENTK